MGSAARKITTLLLAVGVMAAACSSAEPESAVTDSTTSLASAGSRDQTSDDEMVTLELANGLDVVITPRAGAPTVAIALVFEIGSDHDPTGQSGLAHFAEHLLITGATTQEAARDVTEIMGAYPNGWNAQTGTDFTILATVIEPQAFEAELAAVAARLTGVMATAEDVERERGRILIEVDNMFGSIPDLAVANLAREQLRPTPNGGRRGGDPTVLATVGLDELQAWMANYRPGVATLSIAGPVDGTETTAMVEAMFGSIAEGPGAPSRFDPDPPENRLHVQPALEGSLRYVTLAYEAPAPSDPRYPAYLTGVGRLFIESQTADLRVMFAPIDDPTSLTITADIAEDETVDDAAARLRSSIIEVLTAPLRPGEGDQTAQLFGVLLGLDSGTDPNAGLNTYGVAFSAARRPALGMDPAKVEAGLESLADDQYREAISALIVDAPLIGAAID
ncbi:MAG: M16 family metallopeptidase [Acidimicrobiales bacterium]